MPSSWRSPSVLDRSQQPWESAASVGTPSLAQWIQQQPSRLTWRQAADLVLAIADRLSVAHEQGLVCGAVCPETILVSRDASSAVAEFSLDIGRDAYRQSDSVASATGRCTAPEQLEANLPIDSRCDVYAAGVILYWLLCQRYPFRSIDSGDLTREIIADAPQPPRQIAYGIPKALEQLCLRLLAKHPSARPASGNELAQELRAIIAECEAGDLSTAVTSSAAVARQPARAFPDVELRMVLRWDPPLSREMQDSVRESIERHHGRLLVQTSSTIVAHLKPSGEPATGLTTFLRLALSCLLELCNRFQADTTLAGPDHSAIGFAVESAETDKLDRRAPRMRGRLSAQGLEVTPQTQELLRRWLPGWSTADIRALLPAEAIPLVGRTSQLAILRSRWDQACEGLGQIVLLIGDEGIGKTRLVDELQQSVSSDAAFLWIRCICRPGAANVTLHPLIEFFTDADTPSALRLNAAGLTELTGAQRREHCQQLLLGWLNRVADELPAALVVEDLQWADPGTLTFLHSLIDSGLNARVLTILTFRPEFETPWGSRAHQTQVALSRLTRRHCASLFAAITGITEPSENVVDELMAATAGIPLYVEGFASGWPDRAAPQGCLSQVQIASH